MANRFDRLSVFNLVATAMLMALILVLMITGLGYIPIGLFTLTILTLPVAVGTVVLGPTQGLILGAVFGLTSFATCFSTDALGMLLLSINPVCMFIVCVVPRVLCGWLPGLLFCALQKRPHKSAKWHDTWTPAVCCAAVAVLNTLLFLGSMWLFFGEALTANYGIASVGALFVAFAGVNALVEIAANLLAGGAICRALLAFRRRQHI